MRIWTILAVACASALAQQRPATPAAQPNPAQASPAATQPAEPAEPAPPEVDAALRERVQKFYQAFVSGKFSAAFEVVAEDNRDEFIGSSKDTYKACETAKIAYSEHFAKAAVTESCKGDWRWHGRSMAVTMPLTSFWKVIDGKWYWYSVKQLVYETPFGKMSPGPGDGSTSQGARSLIPSDPKALAANILKQVTIDKTEVHIDSSHVSTEEIRVSNGMPGRVQIKIDDVGQPGLSVKADKTQLMGKDTARILVRYDPNDPALMCSDCSKRMDGTAVATVHVSPTGQVFQIKIVFERPAASAK